MFRKENITFCEKLPVFKWQFFVMHVTLSEFQKKHLAKRGRL